jgi:hypothetical protein
MNEREETREPFEAVFVFINYETGERETQVVEGTLRRNPKLTPEERAKYRRFHERRKQEAEARAKALEQDPPQRKSA